jgi:hypothetical protein
MHDDITKSIGPIVSELSTLRRRMQQIKVAFAISTGALILCIISLALWSQQQSRDLRRLKEDVFFGEFVQYDSESDDYVLPNARSTQFFHNGYSLEFDTVQYLPDGLLLSGRIGNPNQFRITALALNFAVRPYPEKIREKWQKLGKHLLGWPPEWDLGSARANVGDLDPGKTARFKVTIPNVKQPSDQIRIAVSFSGESYTY